jgi:hypothetical protein
VVAANFLKVGFMGFYDWFEIVGQVVMGVAVFMGVFNLICSMGWM